METNDQQLEDLKKKIEKYRQAVESLKNRRDEDAQLKKRMQSLEEQIDQFQNRQMELNEQMNVMQSFMDEVRDGVDLKNSAAETNRAGEEGTRRYQQSRSKTIPSFNTLKKLANETPVLYTNSQSSSQEVGNRNGSMNKKHHYKALLSIDAQQLEPPIEQNDIGKMDGVPDLSRSEQKETLPIEKESIQVEAMENVTKKPGKANSRAVGFWKGILRN